MIARINVVHLIDIKIDISFTIDEAFDSFNFLQVNCICHWSIVSSIKKIKISSVS